MKQNMRQSKITEEREEIENIVNDLKNQDDMSHR